MFCTSKLSVLNCFGEDACSVFLNGDIRYTAYEMVRKAIIVVFYVLRHMLCVKDCRYKGTWLIAAGQGVGIGWGLFQSGDKAAKDRNVVGGRAVC